MQSGAAVAAESRLCTFFVDDLLFGIDLSHVREVLKYQEITSVPLAPPVVRGLINLRGQIVTAIDFRRRLRLAELRSIDGPMNVVIHADEELTSLLVDEVGDIVTVSAAQYEDVPDTIRPPVRDLVAGVYKLEGQLLLVLDRDKARETGACVAPTPNPNANS